jgi:uncharacterized protein (TIGR03086 family)
MDDDAALDRSIELLDRALGYTRAILTRVDERAATLVLPTPCHRWNLGQLLAHMEDALDAFSEGAAGTVSLDPQIPAVVRIAALRRKACDLLGVWSSERPAEVRIGDQSAPTAVVAAAAALEITVHGWDVGQAIGQPTPIPEELATRLLPVADAMVPPDGRDSLFAPVVAVPAASSAETHLLAYLGRDRSMPLGSFRVVPGTGPRIAS